MTEDLTKKYDIVWNNYTEKDHEALEDLSKRYISFMSDNKTERECISTFVETAETNGFKNLNKIIKSGDSLKPGDKIYAVDKNKILALFVIGQEPLENGLKILGAHVDSPRIDLKQNPLYEDGVSNFAMFDTHYYGGIKKYQWVNIPMAIHGVVAKKDGSLVNIVIGEDDNDPVIGISDLLVHLAKDQLQKTLAKGIEGEDLNVLIGSIPLKDSEGENKVKLNILKILNEKYGITEEDFTSAELEVVPAGKAREYGIDRSMIMAYGHDDRVCAFTSFEAILNIGIPDKTCVALFVDKEEIGSVGASSMQSKFFENAVAELINCSGRFCAISLRRTLANSKMLSSDVSVAYDPNFPSVTEKNNTSFFGKGIVFNKYTGSSGKYASNDANPEFIAEIRSIMEKHSVAWQTGELGKVDQGGGGTIAYILAAYGMEVLDCGVPVLNMHAPWEICSKADIYETEKGYEAFLKEA